MYRDIVKKVILYKRVRKELIEISLHQKNGIH